MNHKSLLAVFFAAMSCAEMTHPIIFTGPARRNAHREQEQEAYAAGMMAGAAEAGMTDQNSDQQGDDVQIQAYPGGNTNYPSLFTPPNNDQPFQSFRSMDRLSDIANAYENNNALTNVTIQSIEPDVAQPAQDHAAEHQPAVHEEPKHDQPAPTLMMHEAQAPEVKHEEVKHEEQAAHESAPQVHEELKHQEAPTLMMHEAQAPEIKHEEVKHEEQHHEQAVLPAQEIKHEEIHVPAIEHAPATVEQEHRQAQAEPQVHLVQAVQASQELFHAVQPAEHKVENLQPVAAAPQIKIVKVYPVYEAIKAAVDRVYNASRDMVDYVWSFVSSKEKPEVKVQACNSGVCLDPMDRSDN